MVNGQAGIWKSRKSSKSRKSDDVIFGCVSQRGEQDNDIARGAVLGAGLPESIPGVTLNRFCPSGLTACNLAAQTIMAGQQDLSGTQVLPQINL